MNHLYPTCTLHTMEQRSPEWLEKRAGYLTASGFGDWLATIAGPKPTKAAVGAMQTAIAEIIAATAGCEKAPDVQNFAMKRGTEMEPEAVAAFEKRTGLNVEAIGFAAHSDYAVGCSPDGLIQSEAAGLELKCPLGPTAAKYLLDGELPAIYKQQVHGSMAVTGCKVWYFASYCPQLPMLVKRVEWDEYTDAMLAGMKVFDAALIEAADTIDLLWMAQL